MSETMMAAWFVVGTLSAIALLHVYWAFGGSLDSDRVIPKRQAAGPVPGTQLQVPAFRPSRRITLLVAAALAAAASLVALRAGLFAPALHHCALQAAVSLIALVFLVRAVGDFRLVGFFKPDNGTAFASWDRWLYSPLSVAMGSAAAFVAWR